MWDIPFRMIPLRPMRPSAIDCIRAEYAMPSVLSGTGMACLSFYLACLP